MAIPTYGSERAKFEVKALDSSNWNQVPHITTYGEGGGANPTREVTSFSTMADKQVGGQRIPSITVDYYPAPHLAVWGIIRTAWKAHTLLDVRLTLATQVMLQATESNDTVAITTSGVVTFAGDVPARERLSVGLILVVGSEIYIVDEIDESGQLTVNPAPMTSVSATANYSLIIPSTRRAFAAYVTMVDRFTVGSESTVTSQLMLEPKHQLPDWRIV